MVVLRLVSDFTDLGATLDQRAEVVRSEHQNDARFATHFVRRWVNDCMAAISSGGSETFLRRQGQDIADAVIDKARAESLCTLFGDASMAVLLERIRGIIRLEYGHGFNDMELIIYELNDTTWIGFRAAPT